MFLADWITVTICQRFILLNNSCLFGTYKLHNIYTSWSAKLKHLEYVRSEWVRRSPDWWKVSVLGNCPLIWGLCSLSWLSSFIDDIGGAECEKVTFGWRFSLNPLSLIWFSSSNWSSWCKRACGKLWFAKTDFRFVMEAYWWPLGKVTFALEELFERNFRNCRNKSL